MKHLSLLLIGVLLCFASTTFAGETTRAQQNLFELEPVYTLNARNAQKITVNLTYDNFTNVTLEEADEFDGFTTTAELIIPFGKDNGWELRFEYPFRTEGDARLIATGETIDIEGNAGVFDFANLVIQKELSTADKCPVNTSIYAGYGHRTEYLETSIDDVYNHTGDMFRFGFNIDNAREERDLRIQASIEGRSYSDTDDLNPSSEDVQFYLMNLSGAAVYNAKGMFKPAFEILYSTDFEDRQIIQAIPEVIIPLGDMLEIKGAYAIGEGQDEGTTQTATIRTTFKF